MFNIRFFVSIMIPALLMFNLTCFDMYNEVWDSADSSDFLLSIIETSSTNSSRILSLDSKSNMNVTYTDAGLDNCVTSCIADFNNKGGNDVLFVFSGGNSRIVYKNESGGYYISYSPSTIGGRTDAVTADFDNDGDTDIFAVGNIGGYVYLVNNGNDSFTANNIAVVLSDNNGNRSSVSDFDGDGDSDIIIGTADTVQLFTNNLKVDGTLREYLIG